MNFTPKKPSLPLPLLPLPGAMQLPVLWLLIAATAWAAQAITPTRTVQEDRRAVDSSHFVTSQDGQFMVNGSAFRFVGTNAYWLPTLNSEEDVINTLSNISASNITVVRLWAFNDVEVIPENGTWFQLVSNGTLSINNGTNGLAKLDMVVKHAQNMGIYVLLSLTNNWNPRPLFNNLTASIDSLADSVQSPSLTRRDVTVGTNNTLARNTLSNDYGGMDLYVRQFGLSRHDEFYTNETLLNAFKNYTRQVVSRYVDSPAVFGWEIANDPRCNSSVAASPTCNTTTVTDWHNTMADHIRSVDPNHLIGSGAQGFLCVGCPKRFPLVPPPQPATSPLPQAKRAIRRGPLTKEEILEERKQMLKKRRLEARRSGGTPHSGVRIRGKWVAPSARRQDQNALGPSMDGSQGVDSEDIINIPQIGFGSFQLFPDQFQYGTDDPDLPAFNNTVEQGLEWIRRQAQVSQIFGKPMSLTGFGLVTQSNAPFFVPFNNSVAPFGPDQVNNASGTVQPFGVTDEQRDDAYQQWLSTGLLNGLQGMIQYQWGQGNLTAVNGTSIVPETTSNGVVPETSQNGLSPNDGYTTQGIGQEGVQGIIQSAGQNASSSP